MIMPYAQVLFTFFTSAFTHVLCTKHCKIKINENKEDLFSVMAFRFNFSVHGDDKDNVINDPCSEDDDKNNKNPVNMVKRALPQVAQPVLADCQKVTYNENTDISTFTVERHKLENGVTISQISAAEVQEMMERSNKTDSGDAKRIKLACEENSDLIPNVYEGGLKVWECSVDLMDYLAEAKVNFKNQKVIELGCGAGLPGLYAYKQRASAIVFQDYNYEVLHNITIPNVRLNTNEKWLTLKDKQNKKQSETEEQGLDPKNCTFLSGDWENVEIFLRNDSIQDNKYDFILTSETIYNPDCYMKLHKIMQSLLKETGVVYLAAKSHYFGVGGSVQGFLSLVEKQGVFKSDTVKKFDEGVKREIMKLTFK